MVETAVLDRAGPLRGHRMVAVTPLPPMVRLSLRGPAAALAGLKTTFGVAPGDEACRAQAANDRAALWLGPDEWILVASAEAGAGLFAEIEQALAAVPHSLVDISHRNTGFAVAGDGAATLLAEGMPLDLSIEACPVGMCTRTILGKSEVILWRTGPDRFQLDCWRSFAPYVAAFLAQAAENL